MVRADFRFLYRLRVRWAEVDAQKIVFNGHYLMYVDTAISDYWRALALPYPQALESFGGDLYVKKATLEYHASAQYDDQLDVGIRCERVGNSSMLFQAGVFRQDELLVSGELVYVYADPVARSAMRVPEELRAALAAYEAGQSMLEVRVGGWDTLGDDARLVRKEVYVDEQRIPAEMEWDEADLACVQAVAYNRLGMPLATGRLMEHVPGVAKIGRMATRRTMRGGGAGRAVLDALMQAARRQGYREAVLHAQLSATSFYLQAGFATRGPQYEELGIPHVEMVKVL
ncbi:YbgC/FadM family acyl-CoA thioesterase [Aquabacterium sp. A7-Y]|uniref:YbgC/FadM family acyl-CoA thioesterase n=1 Tax=Aquabacterium sp. A7-Y TaxID=1349605 RepID=UPI00223E34FE|nr:YbgC/FadM family acyl-CoA thioesterase [Aquabacterium sp. A7-Y]MCW7540622.1 YbgC/FadM family acyl-CoA thioesterase [Aquabacterium sp. A7-Y]